MKFFASILIVFVIALCDAIQKDQLFPYGLTDERLASDVDDGSSPEIQLSVPIVFYETIYKSIFVSHNKMTYSYKWSRWLIDKFF